MYVRSIKHIYTQKTLKPGKVGTFGNLYQVVRKYGEDVNAGQEQLCMAWVPGLCAGSDIHLNVVGRDDADVDVVVGQIPVCDVCVYSSVALCTCGYSIHINTFMLEKHTCKYSQIKAEMLVCV
jgi:hypothetical protein